MGISFSSNTLPLLKGLVSTGINELNREAAILKEVLGTVLGGWKPWLINRQKKKKLTGAA
jgi:hypothetical protein